MKLIHASTTVVFMAVGTTFELKASPELFVDGIQLGDSDMYLQPSTGGAQDSLFVSSDFGGLWFFSGLDDSTPGAFNGGINFEGAPFRILLGSAFESIPVEEGKFQIWSKSGFINLDPPLFSIDSNAGTASFEGVDVSISDGNLSVGGSPVATVSSVPLVLEGLTGKVVIGNGTATGTNAVAVGLGSPSATADSSFSIGTGTRALTFGELALGSYNASASGNGTTWIGSDSLFTLGNGTGISTRSDAIRVLKNGKTTLSNKTWSNTTPLSDPDDQDSTDADGEALEVNGHTLLNGKVTMAEPQGDISMGLYE